MIKIVAKSVAIGIGMVLIVLLGIGSVLWFEQESYKRFRVEEKKTIPLFDSLNADIFSEIETPPGVEKTGEHQGGILSAHHGRYLWIDYHMFSVTREQVSIIYDNFLISNGWEELWRNANGTNLYYRETSCVEINYLDDYHYVLIITNDYFNQSFSPTLPPLWVIRLNEFGETKFEQCPPYPYSSRPK